MSMSDNSIVLLEILKVSSEMEGIALDWTDSLYIYVILHSVMCIKIITEIHSIRSLYAAI